MELLQGHHVVAWAAAGGALMGDRRRMRYHHIGVPTTAPRRGEIYLERFKMYTSGFDTSPYGVEWLRFEPDSPLPDLVKAVAHVGFVVDDLEAAISGHEILIQPNSPSEGVTVAFIVHDGAPVEFLQFADPKYEVWPGGAVGTT